MSQMNTEEIKDLKPPNQQKKLLYHATEHALVRNAKALPCTWTLIIVIFIPVKWQELSIAVSWEPYNVVLFYPLWVAEGVLLYTDEHHLPLKDWKVF